MEKQKSSYRWIIILAVIALLVGIGIRLYRINQASSSSVLQDEIAKDYEQQKPSYMENSKAIDAIKEKDFKAAGIALKKSLSINEEDEQAKYLLAKLKTPEFFENKNWEEQMKKDIPLYFMQAAISVNLLEVNANKSISLNKIIQDAKGLHLTPDAVLNEEAKGLNFVIFNNEKSASLFSGSEAVMNAVAKQGNVSILTSSVITTTNNRTAPIRNTTSLKYASSINVTRKEDGTVERETKMETIDGIGFNIELLPRIADAENLRITWHATIKNVLELGEQEIPEGGKIALPEVEEKTFMQEAVMKTNQTLVITGFEKNSAETKTKKQLVMIITPRILENPIN